MFEPWKNDPNFVDKYFVLIATKASWVSEISTQLDDVGVPYISSDAYVAALLCERTKNIVRLLDDDYSKASYLGLAWYWLTHDLSLCQYSDNQYFCIPSFSYPVFETIVDIGAYTGETTEEYIRRSFGNCKVFAFEPDEKNFTALEFRFQRLKREWHISDDNLFSIQAGVGAKTNNVRFKNIDNKTSSCLSDTGEMSIKLYGIDDFFKDKKPPTIIKSDIEGAEKDMIYGAAGIIKEYKPKMAISIYHLPDDFIKIPEMINELNSTYNFAVRTHSCCYEDTILYCY